jgi:CHAD domain-containing protein
MSSKLPQTVLAAANSPDEFVATLDPALLTKWMRAVLEETDSVRKHFKPRHVHDLRVALRRCRSIAQGLAELDTGAPWTRLRKEAKKLLAAFGALRDVEVTRSWIVRLRVDDAASIERLAAKLDASEVDAIRRAEKALSNFDKKQWRKWTHNLPERAARVPADSLAAELLALERWNEAWEAHRYALRTRSKTALHRVRIALKRFRYSVENFLPARRDDWGKELKKLQDLLGEIHDLDVLWAAIVRLKPALPAAVREKWRAVIQSERARRFARYRAKMTGPKSSWQVWRNELPEGDELERARLDWLAVWATFLDPDFSHSAYVAEIATQLCDGILAAKVPLILPIKARSLLEAAAILHDIGRAEGQRNHQKKSYHMIQERMPPPGWSPSDMQLVASIARYHRGAFPSPSQKSWSGIPADQKESVMFLAGILRLATALGSDNSSIFNDIQVESIEETGGSLIFRIAGYSGAEPLASRLAADRHLLEIVLHRPIIIEPNAKLARGVSAAG